MGKDQCYEVVVRDDRIHGAALSPSPAHSKREPYPLEAYTAALIASGLSLPV